jgi:transketolase
MRSPRSAPRWGDCKMRATCINRIHELAKRDPRVVYIGSDPGAGILQAMKQEFPDRFFIEGVSEANVIGMAAGLAMEGYVPYVNTIATFLTRRCYEQIAIDVCLHHLPVRLIANGGGVVYAPLGPTHEATDDLVLMRALPGMAAVAVADADEMIKLMDASLDWKGPLYVRLAKGGDTKIETGHEGFAIGKAVVRRPLGDVVFVATGIMLQRCLRVAELLGERGVSCGVIQMSTVKPLDIDVLESLPRTLRLLVSAEEHARVGGLGSAILETLSEKNSPAVGKFLRLGLRDEFIHHYGSQDDLLRHYQLDVDGILNAVLAKLETA